jgi:uncharacterized repeat protein (TIGR01451 family)
MSGQRFFGSILALASIGFAVAGSNDAHAALTAEPLTWNIVGLDSNTPLTGPKDFPVGARVCSSTATTNVSATLQWTTANAFVDIRPGSLSTISLGDFAAGECKDAYFEVEVAQNPAAFDTTRGYRIVATDGVDTGSTPQPRELYVEHLISQNRNAITNVRYGTTLANLTSVAPGAGMNLVVGNTYLIELSGGTATQGYEQFEAFINFTNTIFRIVEVNTTYSADTSVYVTSPSDKLYADACGWENDPNSPNYRACVGTPGKAGGTNVVTIYTIQIIGGGGTAQSLNTLLYDFSGSSYHYNADYGVGARVANIVDPTNVGISKSFSPSPSTAGGVSALTITLSNPNPATLTGYNVVDPLPAGLVIAPNPAASTSGCGAALLVATAGANSISFSDGTIAAGGSCAIRVNVTAAAVGSYTNITSNLFIDDADSGLNATATLVVNADPPPGPGLCGVTLARWNFPTGMSTTSPAPTIANVTASATAGAGLTPVFSSQDNTIAPAGTGSWSSNGGLATSAAVVTTNNDYFEFAVDTTGRTSIALSFDARRTNNGPLGLAVYVGTSPGAPETGTSVFNNANALPAAATWVPFSGGTLNINSGLNPSGATYLRIYGFASSNINPGSDLNVDNVLVTGCGEGIKPTIAKSFSPNPIAVGQVSTLNFTLTNANAALVNGATFTDALPAGLQVAAVPNPSTTCAGAPTWAPAAGATNLVFGAPTGATLPASGSCTASVNVTATTPGPHTNVTGFLSTTETGTNTTSVGTATLNVVSPPVIDKVFTPSPVVAGGTSRLRFDIENPNQDHALSGVAFSDTFPLAPAPMTVAPVPNVALLGCGAGVFTATPGSGAVSLSGATIAAGEICTLLVDVTAAAAGNYLNTTGNVSAIVNGLPVPGNTATSTLVMSPPNPSIALLKQVGLTAAGPWLSALAVAPGDSVFYRFTAENTGDVPLSGVALTDPLLDVSGCVLPAVLPVAVAANDNHIGSCVVGPIVAVSGLHLNTAEVTGSYLATPVSDDDSAQYATTGLSFDKTATPLLYSVVGDVINYSFLVTNSGFAALAGPIVIDDDLTADESCPALTTVGDLDAFLDPGEALTCSASYTIQAADISAGSVANTAFATTPSASSPPDTATVTLIAPQLTLSKIATPSSFAVGQPASYTITVQNTGTAATSGNIVVTDALPTGITLGGFSGANWNCTGTSNITCTFSGTLGATASTQLVLDVIVSAGASSGDNTAVVSGGGDDTCPVASRCTASVPVGLNAPALTLTKAATPGTFVVGQPASYTITVSNTGAAPTSANISVADTLPAGITLVTASGTNWSCVGTTNLVCTFTGTLAIGASTTLTLDVSVDASATGGDNTATASGGGDPTCPVTERCSDTVVVGITSPSLLIEKSATPGSFSVGQPGSYSIVVSNTGNAATTGDIIVADSLPTGITLGSFGGAGWACTGTTTLSCTFTGSLPIGGSTTLTLNVDVAAGGSNADNTATVSGGGDPACPAAASCSSTVPVPLDAPTLSVTKSASPTAFVIGQPASYTITVQNTGVSTTSGEITISDTLPTGIALTAFSGANWTCVGTTAVTCTFAGTLAPNAITTLTLDVSVGAGTVNGDNSATASGGSDPTCPVATRCTGTVTVGLAAPELTVSKIATPTTFVVGQPASYTVTLQNTGTAATTADIMLADPLPAGLMLTGFSGTNWTCSGSSSVACTFSGTLAIGASTQVTLNVSVGAAATSGDNSATASGGGDPTCPVATRCVGTVSVGMAAPQLSIVKTATPGSFSAGQPASYSIVVANNGTAASSGDIVVTDNLPTGVTLASFAGAGWTCVGTTNLSCTYAASLPAGASTTLTLTVNVAGGGSDANNTANVGGGGDPTCPSAERCSDTVLVPLDSPALSLVKTATPSSFVVGQPGTYTLVVQNTGVAATNAAITLTDTLPTGITLVTASGTNWACVGTTALTCTFSGTLAPAASTTLTLNVAVAASATSGDNSATVSGGGDTTCPVAARCTGSVPVPLGGNADLTIAKSHTGDFTPGQIGASYSIVVSNIGSTSTDAPVSVSDTLPTGLTATAIAGSGWTCSLAPLACNRADFLDAGASWPPITVTVNVADEVAEQVINVATVSGGGDDTPLNNTAQDPTAIPAVTGPDLQASKTHTGTFLRGQTGALFVIGIANVGTGDTAGVVTVTDTLPTGLTATAIAGSGWTCTLATVSCTRADVLAAGASWPNIFVTVTVAEDAPANMMNIATVTGGGDVSPPNNLASDPTILGVGAAPVLVPGPSLGMLALLGLLLLMTSGFAVRRRIG